MALEKFGKMFIKNKRVVGFSNNNYYVYSV